MRSAHDGTAEGGALAFSFRELAGKAIQHALQAESRRGLENAACGLRVGEATHFQRKGNVFANREVWIQRVALKHHRYIALGGRVVRDHSLADDDLAGGGLLETGDAAKHRRLAGARRPEQDEQLTIPHVEIQVVQCLNAAVKDFAQPAEGNRRHPLRPSGR